MGSFSWVLNQCATEGMYATTRVRILSHWGAKRQDFCARVRDAAMAGGARTQEIEKARRNRETEATDKLQLHSVPKQPLNPVYERDISGSKQEIAKSEDTE